jgi:hypothetical protein
MPEDPMRSHVSLESCLFIAAALLGGCSTSPTEPDLRGQARALVVAPTTARIATGGTLQLNVTIPASNQSVTLSPELVWSSSDEEVAGVTAHGLVIGRRGGFVDIIAQWNGMRAVSHITVIVNSDPKLRPSGKPKNCPAELLAAKRSNATTVIPTTCK